MRGWGVFDASGERFAVDGFDQVILKTGGEGALAVLGLLVAGQGHAVDALAASTPRGPSSATST